MLQQLGTAALQQWGTVALLWNHCSLTSKSSLTLATSAQIKQSQNKINNNIKWSKTNWTLRKFFSCQTYHLLSFLKSQQIEEEKRERRIKDYIWTFSCYATIELENTASAALTGSCIISLHSSYLRKELLLQVCWDENSKTWNDVGRWVKRKFMSYMKVTGLS